MSLLVVKLVLLLFLTHQTRSSPLKNGVQVEQDLAEKYAALKQSLVHDLGYTEEFAALVEVNLKRAIKQEEERRKTPGVSGANGSTIDVRQQAEDYEDEEVPTTPGATPTDTGTFAEAQQQIEDYEFEVTTTPISIPLEASSADTGTIVDAQPQTEDYEEEVTTTPPSTTPVATIPLSSDTTPGSSPTGNTTVVDVRQQTEDYEDELTTVPPSTTPGLSATNLLEGFGMIVMGLTFNVRNFVGNFVNLFPAGQQREGAQALMNIVFAGQSGMTTVSSVKATSGIAASAPAPNEPPATATVANVIRFPPPPMRYVERVKPPSTGCSPDGVRVFQGLQGGVIC